MRIYFPQKHTPPKLLMVLIIAIMTMQQGFSKVRGLSLIGLCHRIQSTSRTTSFNSFGGMRNSFTEPGAEFSTSASSNSQTEKEAFSEGDEVSSTSTTTPVWNRPAIRATVAKKKRNNNARFRQHVNPLSRLYQQPTVLPSDWPLSVYSTVAQRPLHLDIGCSKGGFLIDICQKQPQSFMDDNASQPSIPLFNFLGLEIRPGVAAFAKERIAVHQLQGQLDFLGCNANVDLDRILGIYQSHYNSTPNIMDHQCISRGDLCLHRVTIQFPDPHFKNQHAKRRVVTAGLVDTLAKYMPPEASIILQSDVKLVLDDMRQQFRSGIAPKLESMLHESLDDQACRHYFTDSISDLDQYIAENSLGVPTERELSVLNQGLPVYRSLLRRSYCPYPHV
jgi:tRNA (guanine-N7-)-methyltransferase